MFYLDRIHTSAFGARVNAESAIEGIRQYKGLKLAKYLKPIESDSITGSSRKEGCPILFTIGDSTVKNEDHDENGLDESCGDGKGNDGGACAKSGTGDGTHNEGHCAGSKVRGALAQHIGNGAGIFSDGAFAANRAVVVAVGDSAAVLAHHAANKIAAVETAHEVAIDNGACILSCHTADVP